MTTIRLFDPEDSTKVYYFTTKNKRIKDAVYIYKKRHNITHKTVWREDKTEELPTDEKLVQRIKDNTNSPNTARNYISAINRFIKDGGKPNDMKNVEEYLKGLPINQRETFLYSMIKVNKIDKHPENIDKLLLWAKESKGLVKLERQEQAVEKVPKSDAVSLDDLNKKATVYPDINKTYKFIAELYTREVPLRADTIVHITKSKTDKNMNLFYPSKHEIQLNKYKTISTHGQKNMEISPTLTKLIKQQFKDTQSQWLLPSPSDKNKPMSANTLSKIIISIFGVGVKEIRHIYLTHARKTKSNIEFVRICHRMNTSAECGNLVYNDGPQPCRIKPQKEETRKVDMDEELE